MKTKLIIFVSLFLYQAFTSAHALRFIKDLSLTTGTEVGGLPLGGLSGCAYDENQKRFYAISDDRSERAPARIFEFEINLEPEVKISPKNVLLLTDEKGNHFAKRKVDFEALVLLENGNFLLSSEGNGDLRPRLPPEFMLFDSMGKRLSSWSLPSYLVPEQKSKQLLGVRNNLAFEAFSKIPNTQKLLAISEQALIQDGPETGNDTRSPSRVLVFEAKGDYRDAKVVQSYVYQTDSFFDILNEPTVKGDSGVSETLALNEKEFIVLERSFFPSILKTRIRLFKAQIQATSTDVSQYESLKDVKYIPVKKELLVDLNDYLPLLDKSYSSLDNIESMCWGPRFKNGKRSLILVSDNNFNIFQRTQFVILETDY